MAGPGPLLDSRRRRLGDRSTRASRSTIPKPIACCSRDRAGLSSGSIASCKRLPLHINDEAVRRCAGRGLARAHDAVDGSSFGALRKGTTRMPRIARTEILSRLRTKIARGQPIVGGGAGTGLSAKCEEAGGIDLIVIYNSGRYRMAGRGSLAWPAGLRQRERDRLRDGARGAAGGARDAGAGRRQRHRSVHDPGAVPAPPDRSSASQASRTFPPSG
jgi:hypothetical protein